MVMKSTQRFSFLGLLVLAALLLAACQPEAEVISPAVPGISVSISDDTCPGVVVRPGDQVTWTNDDRREHIVDHIPEEGERQFQSGTLNPQDSFAFTFMEPGTYVYGCTENGEARGTVIVEP